MFKFGVNGVLSRLLCLGLLMFIFTSQSYAGDAAAGEKVYVKCKVCHEVEADKSKIGPSLHGLMGREAGSLASFEGFSDAMKSSGITWDETTLKEFLKAPLTYVKGTKMVFLGLKSDEDLDNLLAYLAQFSE